MKYFRKRNGQFKSKSVLFPAIVLGLIMFGAGYIVINHTTVMANIDNYSKVETIPVTNCTLSDNIYTEECLKKITDEVATSLSELVAQEKVVEEEVKLLDEKRSAFNQSVFNLETVAN